MQHLDVMLNPWFCIRVSEYINQTQVPEALHLAYEIGLREAARLLELAETKEEAEQCIREELKRSRQHE